MCSSDLKGSTEPEQGSAEASEHQRLDDRIWHALATLGLSRDAAEVERLRARSEELEGRVHQLEQQVQALLAERRRS